MDNRIVLQIRSNQTSNEILMFLYQEQWSFDFFSLIFSYSLQFIVYHFAFHNALFFKFDSIFKYDSARIIVLLLQCCNVIAMLLQY